jgi:hypothetical protein
MDKLYLDLTNKLYTDIEIILVDAHDTISIHAHKYVLDYASTYFHNLFNFTPFYLLAKKWEAKKKINLSLELRLLMLN